MKPFLETLPPEVDTKLQNIKPPEEQTHIQVATDLIGDGSFGEQWLVVTDEHLFVIPTEGADGVVEVPLKVITETKIEELIGAGRLEVEHGRGEPTYLYYSNSLSPKFAEVAEAIKQLTKGEPPTLPTEMERSRCDTCGQLLPEKDGICLACVKTWDTMKRILSYLAPYRSQVVILMIFVAASPLINLYSPLIVRDMIDQVLTPMADSALTLTEGFEMLRLPIAKLFGILFVTFLFEIMGGLLRSDVSSRTCKDIRTQLFQHVQYMPLRFYSKRQLGSLISRFTNDADRLEMFLVFGLPFMLRNVLMLIGTFFVCLYLSWKLTICALIPVPLILFGGVLIWRRMRRIWPRWHAKWSQLSSHLNESISGIRVVKAFAQEDREAMRFNARNEELWSVSVTGERSWHIFYAVMNFVLSFGMFFIWYFGGLDIIHEVLTFGTLLAFTRYFYQLYQPLQFFSQINNFMSRAFAGAERIFEILDTRSELAEDPEATAMPQMEGRVAFRDATFGYDPGKPVLNDINMDVKPGEMIGLVGKSGVGKSTMINLICRFYDVNRGHLDIDGVDIRKIRLEDLRRHIGMVHQDVFLFDGTIAENIGYGKPGATLDEIVNAAIAAEAHEFIAAKPDGYDTKVGERGGQLSGGEKQRIAIARAILHDPKILILDEATSSLDSATEKKIQAAIARLVKGRTTFAIAHRLSTLRNADRLVVLDDGKVAEVGTHEELMHRKGIFYNLVHTQQQTSAIIAVGGGRNDPSQGRR
ncbi:ABC transporter ATP-binding protein [Candidatus Poribacteria bacterium]|nr:ABC transporter ATP-binding protein [Candidatus Poribacteria bacterium]